MATNDPSATAIIELGRWLDGRDEIHELAIAWPPGCRVTSRSDAPCLIPAPGVIGEVVSYFDAGTVGVVAPMAATRTSLIMWITIEEGEIVKGECQPDWLELVGYGAFTPDDVRKALDQARRGSGTGS